MKQEKGLVPSRISVVARRRVAALMAVGALALLSLLACDSGSSRRTPTPANPDFTLGKRNLSENAVVKLVQQHVVRSGGKVIVQVPYWETRKQKVTCYGDPQLEGCYEDSFSPTGFSKDLHRQVRECCHSEPKSIPKAAAWQADYNASSDEWAVKVEFSLDDAKQLIKWIVDDDSRKVTERR